ncbi:MAG: ATP-binding protein [Rhodocyclaceae bacterium]
MAAPHSPALLEFIVDRVEVGIFAVDREFRIVLWNRFMSSHSQRAAAAVVGKNLFDCFPELPRKWLERKIESVFILKNYAFTSWEQRPFLFRFNHNRPITGGVDAMRQNCTFLPQKGAGGEVELVCVTLVDFTDTALFQNRLTEAIAELEQEKRAQQVLIGKLEDAQNQLMQSEKLAAVGQLAAGIAHEINNPVGFVNSNLSSLERYLNDLFKLVAVYEKATPAPADPLFLASIQETKAAIDYDFLREDCAELVAESRDGLARIKRIVQDLKDFSRVDESDLQWADLEKGLDSTLAVLANDFRDTIEIVREYAAPPPIECMPSQLNQVFMNLLTNARQAIAERGRITLRTGAEDALVWVEIADSGVGIPAENLKRIFEPFFTTRPVGAGQGLGLSVAYSIVAKHQGRIEVSCAAGQGAVFRVWLPVRRQPTAGSGG